MSAHVWRSVSAVLLVALIGSWVATAQGAVHTSRRGEAKLKVKEIAGLRGEQSDRFRLIDKARVKLRTGKGDMLLVTFSADAVCVNDNAGDDICQGEIRLMLDGSPLGAVANIDTLVGQQGKFPASFQRSSDRLAEGQHVVSAKFRELGTNDQDGITLEDIVISVLIV